MRLLRCAAVLFDCDGVLVDSDDSVRAAWTRWARDLSLDPDVVTNLVHGRRSADTVAQLVPAGARDAAAALIDRYELEDAAAVTAIPGAADLARSVPRWAVVTSGRRELALARLAAAGLP
ncbi:MAG: HAD family hydrolase, partial [Jatrophihabitantaceae bacterium]